jgi:adenine-specific DNA-methyltransferase
MDKEQKTTDNIKAPNKDLEILKKHFSHCFDKNDNFDFEKFKQELSQNEINFSKESYNLDWLGKSYARVLASDSANTLLKEDEEFNKKDENINSQNLLIKGDNLEVLKHLSNAYYEKIKMIYIDPPYNTGSDGFVYQDDRKFSVDEFKELAGVDEEKAKRILDFVDSKSNSHSAWLTFIYPRLYIAKQLLRDDGVIFVSIDDNEVAQLRLLMDEIFGEDNFLYQLTVVNNLNGNDNSSGMMETHEYCLIYAKNKDNFEFGVLPIDDEKELEKWQIDEKGYFKEGGGLKATGEASERRFRPNLFFPIYINENTLDFSLEKKDGYSYELLPITDTKDMRWYWCKEKFLKDKDEVIVKKIKNGYSLYKKQRPSIGNLPSKRGKTTFYSSSYSMANSNIYIKKLFNDKKMFDYPKPIELIKDFARLTNINPTDLILDFFAGSGTTGDAVMQLNAEDGGNRKFILVQLPEPIDAKKNKTAYEFIKDELGVEKPTIFEITKERLLRASKKIEEENQDKDLFSKDKNQDLGFKIFETMPIWEDYDFEADELNEQTTLFDENKLSKDDLKALLITWKTYDGLPLTQSLEEIDLGGYKAYYASDKLYLMDKGFETKNLKSMLEKIDSDKSFNPTSIIAFGYHFDSKNLREIAENIKSYANKKNIDIDFITRY